MGRRSVAIKTWLQTAVILAEAKVVITAARILVRPSQDARQVAWFTIVWKNIKLDIPILISIHGQLFLHHPTENKQINMKWEGVKTAEGDIFFHCK